MGLFEDALDLGWGYLKDKVYANKPSTISQLKVNSREEIKAIQRPVCKSVMLNFAMRLKQCMEVTWNISCKSRQNDQKILFFLVCCVYWFKLYISVVSLNSDKKLQNQSKYTLEILFLSHPVYGRSLKATEGEEGRKYISFIFRYVKGPV